jgi:transketolase
LIRAPVRIGLTSYVARNGPGHRGQQAALGVQRQPASLSHRPTQLLSIGVPRRFIGRYGTSSEHDAALGLDVRGIRERILAFLRG